MLINTYELSLNKNDHKKKQKYLDLVKYYHTSKPILIEKDSTLFIKIISIAEEDFPKLFNINNYKCIEILNNNQIKYSKLLLEVIEKSDTNYDRYYNLNIDYTISNKEIFEIIQSNKTIKSYIFVDNIFIICVPKFNENNNIFNLTISNICTGYCPKFDLNKGFYDSFLRIEYNSIIEKLNECYNKYFNNAIFEKLVYS